MVTMFYDDYDDDDDDYDDDDDSGDDSITMTNKIAIKMNIYVMFFLLLIIRGDEHRNDGNDELRSLRCQRQHGYEQQDEAASIRCHDPMA